MDISATYETLVKRIVVHTLAKDIEFIPSSCDEWIVSSPGKK